jgi:glutathione S-transferase
MTLPNPLNMPRPYRIYGHTLSFFTRKLTGFMTYKGLPWLQRVQTWPEHILQTDWPGGMPVVETPEGGIMWDTTAMILHLEHLYPENAVLPNDRTLRFLCFAIEDFSDEWIYRCGPPTRWYYADNAAQSGWNIGRELSVHAPMTCDEAAAAAQARLAASTPPFGVTSDNVQCWVDDVLRPWQRAIGALLETRHYLFGGRPSLADFAIYGGNEAHFNREPLCRRWLEEDAPAVVDHTHRLYEPEDLEFGDWCRPDDIPDALIELLRFMGRHYLPWVAQATVEGQATVHFTDGNSVEISPTDFLRHSRATLLARYAQLRNDDLDHILESAGIFAFYRDHLDQAGPLPNPAVLPRARQNRPYPTNFPRPPAHR